MRVIDCEQNSPEWYAARLGKVTASRLSDVLAKGKSGAPSAMRANYMADLVLERLTGARREGFTSRAIEDGHKREPEARERYEFLTDTKVVTVGFVLHPTIDLAGASPDGLVGDAGLVQIKCPEAKTHLETLLGGSVSGAYQSQMQWEMACTGRLWCDFVSYHPDFPAEMRLSVKRFPRDPLFVVEAERAVREFLAETEGKLSALAKSYGMSEAAQ